ncbi:UPF0617 protein [Talaromyces islandicus]|uniref:UPF0617 protein n=1 Tax=Talaromyces islandicus TaxID=28573 RepID=A0A0U1LYZ5_TALIS|nr:UPF0617 protein [Talaromyces islandicus]
MQHFDRVSKSSSTTSTSNPAKKTKFNAANEPNAAAAGSSKKRNDHHQQEFHQRPTIPYQRKDRILLVGEGDFSFARSLAEHHRCKRVFASCYDSKDVLLGKYAGQVEANIKAFLQAGKKSADEQKLSSSSQENRLQDEASLPERNHTMSKRVLFSVDARKLGTPAGGGKEIRLGIKQKKQTGGPWDIISFNFPHIGGKSTDVNRQVRANQELLVAFFKACVPLLSTSAAPAEATSDDGIDYGTDSDDSSRYHTDSEEDEEEDAADKESKDQIRTVPRQSGQIIVTIFEGEPYTLWNIKDLARHAGLTVVTSFRFPWKSYPGYAHARTLGIVESRSGKVGGGWKGEDRDARTYVFEVKQENGHRQQSVVGKKKRKTEDSSDEGD